MWVDEWGMNGWVDVQEAGRKHNFLPTKKSPGSLSLDGGTWKETV